MHSNVAGAFERTSGHWRAEAVFRAPGPIAYLTYLDHWGLLAQSKDCCSFFIAGHWRRVKSADWKEQVTAAVELDGSAWTSLQHDLGVATQRTPQLGVRGSPVTVQLLLGTAKGALYGCSLPDLSLTCLWRSQLDVASQEPICGIRTIQASRTGSPGHVLLVVATPSRLYFALDPFRSGRSLSESLDLDRFIEASPMASTARPSDDEPLIGVSHGSRIGVLFGDLNWLSALGILHVHVNRSALADGMSQVLQERSWVSLPQSKSQMIFGVAEVSPGCLLLGTRVVSAFGWSEKLADRVTEAAPKLAGSGESGSVTDTRFQRNFHGTEERDLSVSLNEQRIVRDKSLKDSSTKRLSPTQVEPRMGTSPRIPYQDMPVADARMKFIDFRERASSNAVSDSMSECRTGLKPFTIQDDPGKTACRDQSSVSMVGSEPTIVDRETSVAMDSRSERCSLGEANQHLDGVTGFMELYCLADGRLLAQVPLEASMGIPVALLPDCTLLSANAAWMCRIATELVVSVRTAYAHQHRFSEALATCQTIEEKEHLFLEYARVLLCAGDDSERATSPNGALSKEALQRQAAFYLARCRSRMPGDALRELIHEHRVRMGAVLAYLEHRLPIETDPTAIAALETFQQALHTEMSGADADTFLAQPCILRKCSRCVTQLQRLYRLALPGSAYQAHWREAILDRVARIQPFSEETSASISKTSTSARMLLQWGAMLLAEQGNEADLLHLIEQHDAVILSDRSLAGFLLWVTKRFDLWHVQIELLLILDEKVESGVGYRDEALGVVFAHASEMTTDAGAELETLLDRICSDDPTRWMKALSLAPMLCRAAVWQRAILERHVLSLGEALAKELSIARRDRKRVSAAGRCSMQPLCGRGTASGCPTSAARRLGSCDRAT
ncbi:hypothetical protein F1559_004292 [Cyanidiococcus yangmingshanensis]|uniref:Uncharacterized protein n=1 Tax=Cyanidiococcus yangmingshanensis TaxID=2690220 RepID=A0A7J7IKL7_9RHOD|nr:hypothetical protein F1559_004292 [Cyanidiococcus yangmingshanensis]